MSTFYLTIFIKRTFISNFITIISNILYPWNIDELVLANGSPRWIFEVNTIAIYVRGRLSRVSRVTSKHPWVWMKLVRHKWKNTPSIQWGRLARITTWKEQTYGVIERLIYQPVLYSLYHYRYIITICTWNSRRSRKSRYKNKILPRWDPS